MSLSSHAALLDAGDFPGALAAWHAEFNGREDSLDASWELAEIEERWGDSICSSGDAGSAGHYQAAQRALIPPGAMFSSSEENQRRMEAYGRLTSKLYALGGDGKPRSPHEEAPPPPRSTPIPPPDETAPPHKSKAERWEAVAEARKTRARDQSELGRLYGTDQWAHLRIGDLWLKAATALAANHQQLAQVACEWSYHHFEHYNRLWNAHLPASRFDSDGHEAMMEVGSLQNSLTTGGEESPAPEWVSPLLDGDWRAALAAVGADAPAPEFEPLAAILADACKTAGHDISS